MLYRVCNAIEDDEVLLTSVLTSCLIDLQTYSKKNDTGFFIPIIGMPGTGKTRLTRILSRNEKIAYFSIGEYNSDGILQATCPALYIKSIVDILQECSPYRTDIKEDRIIIIDSLKSIFYDSDLFGESSSYRRGGISNSVVRNLNLMSSVVRSSKVLFLYTVSPNSFDNQVINEFCTILTSCSDIIFVLSRTGDLLTNFSKFNAFVRRPTLSDITTTISS